MPDTRDAFLGTLLRNCPRSVPKTNALYGKNRLNLKAMLEARKWAWLPGRRRGVIVGTPNDYFRLPWFAPWIKKARGGSRCTRYSANAHTRVHNTFKTKTSALFARLAGRVRISSNIFVLDDFAECSANLRTLTHLRCAGVDAARIYVANPSNRHCVAAGRAKAFWSHSTLQEALSKEWKNVASGGAYLDTCSGDDEYITALMRAVLHRANHRFILAFTMLGRGAKGKPRTDDDGDPSITSRLGRCDSFLRAHGFVRFGRADKDAVFAFSGGKSVVVTSFYQRGL